MIKLCVWMNIPSHYQSAFFRAVHARDDVNLRVIYLNAPSRSRAAEGWEIKYDPDSYEFFVDRQSSPKVMVEKIPDWRERVHLISGNFNDALVDFFCVSKVQWCHWSEMPGIRLAEMLGYRMELFRFLNPLMLTFKKSEGRRIKKYALGAFGQGELARKAFRTMGVPSDRFANLFYVPGALSKTDPDQRVVNFANGRRIFLSVGALCPRKGIDILLKAIARLNASDWCLVLCGLDRANGTYQALAKKLGIEDRVLFLGAYPSDRIAAVYEAADIFVLPSRFDGWGAVLNEASSLGLPLIGTDLCGASWHLVENGISGCRVRADSVRSLTNAIRTYVDDPSLIKKHGAGSLSRFKKDFTPERNADRLVESLSKWGVRES